MARENVQDRQIDEDGGELPAPDLRAYLSSALVALNMGIMRHLGQLMVPFPSKSEPKAVIEVLETTYLEKAKVKNRRTLCIPLATFYRTLQGPNAMK